MSEPTECRDLHEIVRDDGTPLLPLDHWGEGCPFDPVDSEDAQGVPPQSTTESVAGAL